MHSGDIFARIAGEEDSLFTTLRSIHALSCVADFDTGEAVNGLLVVGDVADRVRLYAGRMDVLLTDQGF